MFTTPVLPWLDPAEKKEVVDALIRWNLLRFSNKRDLPLKSGGTTDIYINLRDARNNPEAIRYIAQLFEIPLRRLPIRRFVEVPDSVSCFAGPISIATGLPYITVREQAKEGRVAKATMIGEARYGERVAILDDVVTNGASKIAAWRECVRAGLKPENLVVLVDREQGWQKKFAEENIRMNVWPGMTLHDVRRHLVSTLGMMERCDPALEAKNPIIVALDGKSWSEILPVIDQLRPTGCILKVNDLLLNKGIEWILSNLSVYGRVMADLKGHDIRSTLENIARHLLKNPPWAVTVHGSGGEDMIKGVVEVLKGTPTKVLVVTVLTSFDPVTCDEIYSRMPQDEVRVLAKIAKRAGAHGLVSSPEEVGMLRDLCPGMELVTPGVRSAGVATHDQKRTDTPAGAIERGANKIVMGRQLFGAPNPVLEVHRVLTEELGITI